MDLCKYLTVLIVLCLKGGETGGGGGKHHDHVKLHIPEFHHHDHHKKVITIHHHHHQPKKEQHHHHHHHHKPPPLPPIPHGHHYSQHHSKVHLKTHTVSKGTGHHHGHHHKHGHHGHHGHHKHHGNTHHDAPSVPAYAPSAPSYEDDYSPSYSPPVPSYDSGYPTRGLTVPHIPHVHGISHTLKQVKVFDSLPGALPNQGVAHGSQGYQVTEEGSDDDVLSVNNLQSSYPATYGYIRGAAPQAQDPFAGLTSQNAIQTHDTFVPAPEFSAVSGGSIVQSNPFIPSAPAHGPTVSDEYSSAFHETGFDDPANSFAVSDAEDHSFIASDENSVSDEVPITFAREAGIQHSANTGNVETVEY